MKAFLNDSYPKEWVAIWKGKLAKHSKDKMELLEWASRWPNVPILIEFVGDEYVPRVYTSAQGLCNSKPQPSWKIVVPVELTHTTKSDLAPFPVPMIVDTGAEAIVVPPHWHDIFKAYALMNLGSATVLGLARGVEAVEIAIRLQIGDRRIMTTAHLIAEGASVPFLPSVPILGMNVLRACRIQGYPDGNVYRFEMSLEGEDTGKGKEKKSWEGDIIPLTPKQAEALLSISSNAGSSYTPADWCAAIQHEAQMPYSGQSPQMEEEEDYHAVNDPIELPDISNMGPVDGWNEAELSSILDMAQMEESITEHILRNVSATEFVSKEFEMMVQSPQGPFCCYHDSHTARLAELIRKVRANLPPSQPYQGFPYTQIQPQQATSDPPYSKHTSSYALMFQSGS